MESWANSPYPLPFSHICVRKQGLPASGIFFACYWSGVSERGMEIFWQGIRAEEQEPKKQKGSMCPGALSFSASLCRSHRLASHGVSLDKGWGEKE